MSEITPSQTVGPFFAYGLTPEGRCNWKPNDTYKWKLTIKDNLVTPDVSGERIAIEGGIYDGDGKPINDAMIEIWQADAQGRYSDPRNGGRAAQHRVQGPWPLRHRQERHLRVRDHQARPGAGPERQDAGAAYRVLHLLARHAAADLYADVFRRGESQRFPIRCWRWCRPTGAAR